MYIRLILIFSFCFANVYLSAFAVNPIYDRSFIIAKAFESRKQFDSAFVYYRKAISKDPSKTLVLLHRAALFVKTKQYDSAMIDYQQVNKESLGLGSLGLARCYASLGKKGEMFNALKQHLESPYKELPGMVRLDSILSRYDQTPEWIAFWNKEWYNKNDIQLSEARYMLKNKDYMNVILNLTDKQHSKLSHELLYVRAAALFYQESYESALSTINDAITSSKKDADYFELRARIEEKMGKYSEAGNDYSDAIVRKPWVFNWYILRCQVLRKAGRNKEAIQQADDYLLLFPDNLNALYEKGAAAVAIKQTLKALQCLNKCIKSSPNNYLYILARAEAFDQTGLSKNALIDYQQAICLKPTCDTAWMKKANLLFRLGQKQEACKHWQQAEKLGNPNAILLILDNCKGK